MPWGTVGGVTIALPVLSAAADPRITAGAEALLGAGLLTDPAVAVEATRTVLAAADAVPWAARVGAAVRAAAETARAAEVAAGGAARWRAAFVRIALAVDDAWEFGGVDASAMLGCLPGDLEALVRACWDADEYGVDAVDGPDAVARLAAAYRDDGDDPAVAALLVDADEGAWRAHYTAGVAALAAHLLPPAEYDDEQWAEFLYGDVEDLLAMVAHARRTVSDGDLAAAGITPAGDRWAGLPLG